MKPLTLTLEGLRSYPTKVAIDLTGRNLVAALGDTGAGKSSLLDALAYALFRKSSWDAKEPRQLITDGAEAMSVDLTFLHDRQHWHVHRTMHVRNPNAGRHHLKNLDTGEEFDGATNVDSRIKDALQMGYETFLRVGLLPQGRFDQLLTATAKERGERLRELFGAESLEAVHQAAVRQSQSLRLLLAEAKAKRDHMPADPEGAAAAAGAAADAATARARHLTDATDRATVLQQEAAAARATVQTAQATARDLAANTVTDADHSLDELASAAADIAARRDALDQRATRVAAREEELAKAITAAETKGEGPGALSKAAGTLESLTARAEELRDERDRLAARADELATESDALTEAEAQLEQREARTQPLTEAAGAAADTNNAIRRLVTQALARTDAAISAAQHVATTAAALTAAEAKHKALNKELGRLEVDTTADAAVADAEDHLDTLQLHNKAAAIATELHPGGDCPVCRRSLPAGFAPAAAADTTELRAAKAQVRRAKEAQLKAATRIAAGQAAVTAAQDAVAERRQEHRQARSTSQEATAEAAQTFETLQALANSTTTPNAGFDAPTAAAALNRAAAIAAAPAADGAAPTDQPAEHLTTPITDALTTCEQAAAAHAERLQADLADSTATIKAQHTALETRRSSHRRDLDTTEKDSKLHNRATSRTDSDIRALPTRIQAMLPDLATDITADQVATALTAVTTSLEEIRQLLDEQKTLNAQNTAHLEQQRTLDQETHDKVDQPLTRLLTTLNTWARGATQAATHLKTAELDHIPHIPTPAGIAETRPYATALSTITGSLQGKLAELSTSASNAADTAQTALAAIAASLTDIDGFDPATDLTTPQALYPLIAAAAQDTREAENQRSKQTEAKELIKPAADLSHAITAGEARLEALEVLRRELVDAKFLGHLMTLRTHALLGAASDLLGQMSEQRFGFAANFNIVSRSSGVDHPPHRLSGGEKFLASLALALALAELHARSGTSLGSLFLDEGFAALDTTTLEAALEVLRAQADGDRFVMVISHLHAVAEAVDDVLWVERTPVGSSARWLTTTERNELVQADLASGLQTLMR
ncbi:AAA family ATPase [Kitasatospora sp. NPDC058201]|uniref:AAA family ATPase n=1 Tax=unclassified Kitasatospora TaxID=2633591 RepID=UPI00364C5602